MSNLKQQLAQAKALRDEARGLIDDDIAYAKTLVSPANLRERAAPQAEQKAQELLHGTRKSALDNKGAIAALAGTAVSAGILWIVREPLMALIEQLTASDDIQDPEAEDIKDPKDATK